MSTAIGTRRARLARATLFGYAGYSVLAAAYLLTILEGEAEPEVLAVAAVIVTAAAGAASLLLGWRFHRPGSRQWTIGMHAILVPVQFVLAVPSGVIQTGLVLSVVVVGLMGPRFPRLPPRLRRLFLTLHVGLSVSWLGLSLAMVLLGLVGLLTTDPGLRHHAYRLMHIFDLAIVIPVVVLSLLSGLMVSLFTKWGLTRHWWVLTKFVVSLSIPITAGTWHFWIAELISRTAADPAAGAGGLGVRLLAFLAGAVVLLSTNTVLSVYKPGPRTPWAKRFTPSRPATPAGAAR